jgi:predicted N-acetyltransferase YhbS
MKSSSKTILRFGSTDDLDAVNTLVEAAIMTWDLPERVKRLSVPSYRYNNHDLEHLKLVIVESATGDIMGIATWEPADAADTPQNQKGLLLHGLYVHPEHHYQGIGSRLLEVALDAGRQVGYDGLLVKANKDAKGFFAARGLRRLTVERPGDYPYRFWFEFKAGGAQVLAA